MSNNNMPTVGATTAALAATLVNNKVNPTSGGGKAFLKFDAKRTGEWLYGPEGESCTGEVFALDLQSLQHGYILWHAKKPDRRLVPINQTLPLPQDPVYYTDAKGKEQVDEAAEARSLEGTFEDESTFQLEVSSFGGRKAIDAMLAELFLRAQQGSPYLFPHVRLDTDSYEHSQYGLVYEPVLTPVAWFAEDGTQEPEEGVKVITGETEAVTQAPEEAPEEAPEDPKPKRRRTRKAA